MSALLSYVDIKTHRLPNALVAANTFGVFCIALMFNSDSDIKYALLTSASYLILFSTLKGFGRNSLGMGDVKFSISCGFVIGLYAPSFWLINVWGMFALAAIVIFFRKAFNKLTWQDRLAFGPYMAISTVLMVLNSLRSVFA